MPDQHKEERPRDPTIAAKINTYRFADYKESMIASLTKVVRVAVETVEITKTITQIDRNAYALHALGWHIRQTNRCTELPREGENIPSHPSGSV